MTSDTKSGIAHSRSLQVPRSRHSKRTRYCAGSTRAPFSKFAPLASTETDLLYTSPGHPSPGGYQGTSTALEFLALTAPGCDQRLPKKPAAESSFKLMGDRPSVLPGAYR